MKRELARRFRKARTARSASRNPESVSPIGMSTAITSAASMRCRIGQQAWSPCRMVASRPGQRWVLTWDQQRVEFVHDGSGQMMMRIGQNEGWLEVEPFWTANRSLCWGAVCATGAIPLE